MGLLTDTDLLLARETAAEALDGTAVYGGGSFVSDGGGGGTTTFVAAGTVACRMAPTGSSGEGEQVQGGRLHPDSEVVFTFPAETPVDHNATIVYSGGTFSVTAVRQRSMEVTRRVEAREVE